MSEVDVTVVLAHGAWADGSSWNKVISGLRSEGVKAIAAPLPLTTLADDAAALDHLLDRHRHRHGSGARGRAGPVTAAVTRRSPQGE